MAYYEKSRAPKPKHRIVDAWGLEGRRLMLRELHGVVCNDCDPSDILVIGEPSEFASIHEALLKKWPLQGERIKEVLNRRLLQPKWINEKFKINGEPVPFSLASKKAAEQLAYVVNTGKLGQGDPELDVRTVVVTDFYENHLETLLERCVNPITVYVVDDTVGEPQGLFPRDPEPDLETAFSPMCKWKVEQPKELIEGLLQEGGITVLAGLFETAKSMWCYEWSAALIEGRPVSGHFKVSEKCEVLYLCMDMSPGLQLKYASYFGLNKRPEFTGLNPKCGAFVALDNPALAEAANGKVLFFDTMLDWAQMEDAYRSEEWIAFFKRLRDLLTAGCKAIVLVAHPTKTGARNTVIDATEFLKDSVTFGGKVDVALAMRRVDNTSKIFVKRIKGRGYESSPEFSFTIATNDEAGNSYISQGKFPVVDRPGEAGTLAQQLKPGTGPLKNLSQEQVEQLKKCHADGKTARQTAREMGKSHNTILNWWKAIGLTELRQKEKQEDMF